MATLKKMTRVGADVRQIARLLQAKAPEGHMLAYITPEEAELLKAQGGSGKPHADTGIPSFEDEGGYGFTENTAYDIGPVTQEPAPSAAPESMPVATDRFASAYQGAPVQQSEVAGQQRVEAPYIPQNMEFGEQNAVPGGRIPSAMTMGGTDSSIQKIDTTPEKSIPDRLAEATGMSKETLARLGLGGVQAVLGARTARKAAEQGRQGKAEQQALAQPYQAKGAELQRAAQAGELTPQSQQSLQAVQAQVAQQTANRGGVGAMQSQAQIEAFRQQLLAQQYDYGLKLSGIGDQIALGAIKTGLQADQYVNELTSSYYNNIARTLLPAPAQQVVTRG